jgi:serine/threonine protein kinase
MESDWWAMGIMLYTMLTRRLPFKNTDTSTLEHLITYKEVSYPEGISKEAGSLTTKVSIINTKTEAWKV